MLPVTRQLARRCAAPSQAVTRSFHAARILRKTDNPVPANDPNERPLPSPVSSTNALPTSSEGNFDRTLRESVEEGEKMRVAQAPNRATTWSRSQQPREKAMVGPRFEQTIMEDQPRPLAAIDLIHKQPVNWIKERVVSCDGGGGPLGHPRIFINVDKPQICWCTYCGLPFAHEKNRKFIEALPNHSYPLEPTGNPAEVPKPSSPTGQSNTGAPLEQR
ncbi:NADH-ubiquinone oxidoreductase [Myriangium duriaei CBS 260.36]|uniref:NADH-ubiquinone oxidoreductase n=1 Tax=Myriangium duriaei CBS 260.36 TaxID=1168546 RepID=A0A9P4MGE0_9PEZI|nr:NADH-ubiquinone oxidoreductase [Myriangium duriaei CBS 260.36]